MLLPSPIHATRFPSPSAEVLRNREQVGEHLAGVQQVGQPVDHRDVGVLGQLLDLGVGERADHDPVHVAREHARGVGDRLAAAELDVARREEERVSAELPGAHLERDARARRRLHEDHRQRFPGERLLHVAPVRIVLGEIEEAVQLLGREVGDGEEVAVGAVGHGESDCGIADCELLRSMPQRVRGS